MVRPLLAARELIKRATVGDTLDPQKLASDLAAQPPGSPLIAIVLRQLGEETRDALVVALINKMGAQRFAALPQVVRREALRTLREGMSVSDAQRVAYQSVEPAVRQADLKDSLAALATEAYRSELKQRFVGERPGATTLTIGGKTLVREGGKPVGEDPSADQQYKALFDGDPISFFRDKDEVDPNDLYHSAKAVSAALGARLAIDPRTRKPVKLEGVTLYRPGLANSIPSAASLLRMAQYTGQLVLMGTVTDGSDGSRLRRLTEYRGIRIPDAVGDPPRKIEIYAIGRLDHAYQPCTTGADVFLEQLEELRRDGGKLGLQVSLDPQPGSKPLNVIAHSQGNIEVAMARLRLAAAGYPNVIARHLAIAPAFRGSMMSDDGPGKVFSKSFAHGDEGVAAVEALDPDALWKRVPEFLQQTVDLAYHGSSDTTARPAFQNVFDKYLIEASRYWVGQGTDGLVDLQSARFVRDPRPVEQGGRVAVAKVAYDHYSVVNNPNSIDELMSHVPAVDPDANAVLRQLAAP